MSKSRNLLRLSLSSARTNQTGATLWIWVFLIAAISLAGIAGSLESGGYFDRVSKERRLVAAGDKMTEAIQSYYVLSPGTVKQLPRSVSDLVLDPRFLGDKKHLQVVEIDPMTEKQEWDEIRNDKGELIGVRSQSRKAPTIIGNLLAPAGSGSGHYSDWRFVFKP